MSSSKTTERTATPASLVSRMLTDYQKPDSFLIPYSPVQPGDEVIGTVPKDVLNLATSIYGMKAKLAQLEIAFQYEFDPDESAELMSQARKLDIELRIAAPTLLYFMYNEVAGWKGPKLTLRAGGSVVVTSDDRAEHDAHMEQLATVSGMRAEAEMEGSPAMSDILQMVGLGDLFGDGALFRGMRAPGSRGSTRRDDTDRERT